MSGLNHVFLTIDSGSYSLDKHLEYKEFDCVELHDDFLQYFKDSIRWIPSINPYLNESIMGLCWYGPTVIEGAGIEKARDIIKVWARLISLAPEEIILTGSFGWVEGASQEQGSYEKLVFSKRDILTKLNKLISYCEIIINSNGEKVFSILEYSTKQAVANRLSATVG